MRNNENNAPREEGETAEPKTKGNSMKQATRRSGYSICLNAKLGNICFMKTFSEDRIFHYYFNLFSRFYMVE